MSEISRNQGVKQLHILAYEHDFVNILSSSDTWLIVILYKIPLKIIKALC